MSVGNWILAALSLSMVACFGCFLFAAFSFLAGALMMNEYVNELAECIEQIDCGGLVRSSVYNVEKVAQVDKFPANDLAGVGFSDEN